jgi:hypothetical protein
VEMLVFAKIGPPPLETWKRSQAPP